MKFIGRPDGDGSLHNENPSPTFCLPSFLSASRKGLVIFSQKRSWVKSPTYPTPKFASGLFFRRPEEMVIQAPWVAGSNPVIRVKAGVAQLVEQQLGESHFRLKFCLRFILADAGCGWLSPYKREVVGSSPITGFGLRSSVGRALKHRLRYLLPLFEREIRT